MSVVFTFHISVYKNGHCIDRACVKDVLQSRAGQQALHRAGQTHRPRDDHRFTAGRA